MTKQISQIKVLDENGEHPWIEYIHNGEKFSYSLDIAHEMVVRPIKFFCPKCNCYTRLIGSLIPLGEELELYCQNCCEETVIVVTRPTTGAMDGLRAFVNVVIPWRSFLSWLARAFTARH